MLQTRTGRRGRGRRLVGRGAMNLDLDDLGVDLLEASMQRPGPLPDRTAGRRASALMMAGRFSEALAALPPDVVLPAPDSDDLQRDHLVQATCRAALGDDGALVWLRQVAPLVSSTDWATLHGPLPAAGGRRPRRRELTPASLAQLQRLGDKGRRVVPRLAADVLADPTAPGADRGRRGAASSGARTRTSR